MADPKLVMAMKSETMQDHLTKIKGRLTETFFAADEVLSRPLVGHVNANRFRTRSAVTWLPSLTDALADPQVVIGRLLRSYLRPTLWEMR